MQKIYSNVVPKVILILLLPGEFEETEPPSVKILQTVVAITSSLEELVHDMSTTGLFPSASQFRAIVCAPSLTRQTKRQCRALRLATTSATPDTTTSTSVNIPAGTATGQRRRDS
ncbi:hypothetical protein BaRGS_00003213 [Batillaria attramentaria]|uniref:Uncharacterized protein n=1 Tax=Batillaria attramentaria TaxID=370345 RepID=A0ABD0M254_9CAEN